MKYYGCGEYFAYNIVFHLVIKHIDKKIRGKDSNGHFIYNSDFTPAYFHRLRSHTLRKNPYFDRRVHIKNSLYENFGVDNFIVFVAMSVLEVIPVTG